MKSPQKSRPKILVVDDEPDNLDLLYRTFRRDYQVLRAESGPVALDILAAEGDVAVIISDQRMPLMSGTEFLSLTATQYPEIIRIILTGYTDVEDLVEAINAGKVFKYVTKPWEENELRAVVQQAVDTHNVLKARTRELCRTLRQESLLNAVTNTIRSALDYRQILQTIVDTVGHMFEVDLCILRPFHEGEMQDEWFVYDATDTQRRSPLAENQVTALQDRNPLHALLAQTVWETQDIQVIYEVDTDERIQGTASHTEGIDPLKQQEIQQRSLAYQQSNIYSSLIVPLICQQELMAVLALHQCQETRNWQDDEVQLVVMVADQAGLAVSQARAYDQVRELAKRESLVNTITTAIRSSLDPQDIFAAITQQLGQALQVDGCALSLWTGDDEFVQCVGLYDRAYGVRSTAPQDSLSPELSLSPPISQAAASPIDLENLRPHRVISLPQSVVPIAGNPVLVELLATKQPVVIDDLRVHEQERMLDLPLRERARALLVVPLLSDGQIIGSISLRQTQSPRKWHLAEIELAQSVAAQAAIAVQQSRLYQKTRQQAEQLLELDRQKTEFFQNISHEFRTPLTLTIGPLESAVAAGTGLNYEQSAIALRNQRRLLRLVNQLLDLQRLDAGRMQPSFRPCDLVELVSQIVETFRSYCDKKGIQLVTQLAPIPPIYLDVERFDKVLYNLLSNAMKFTNVGGQITVIIQKAGNHCLLQIQDTGIGIRADQIPHLFERFRQAEGSVNRSYEGTGLGLALVRELMELHGGQISVESVYGEGSTFSVWLQTGTAHLPAEQVIEVPTELQARRAAVEFADIELEELVAVASSGVEEILAPDNPVTSEATILVVDDNADLRTYVSSILTASNYQVILARNGAQGFELAQEQRPDLIVTDLMMPVVSGLDMIVSIRNCEEIKGTPIILLTAKVDEDTRIEGAERGADAYLSKPFNDRELLAEVRNLLALKANERRVSELNTYLTESVLRRFLPPAMVQKAAVGELSLSLRPEPRLITILFSDIVGFTQISNTLRSRRVAEVLNEYLEEMSRAVFSNGGTVDKFMGDAVLAIFGAPEDLSPNEQVKRAIATARNMYERLEVLNQRWESNGTPQVRFRCGIHQGTAVVGMFGSVERADYTAIGPAVNIASRLQQAAEPSSILVSAAVADYLPEEEITKCSPLKLKGVDETVLTFAVSPFVPKPEKAISE